MKKNRCTPLFFPKGPHKEPCTTQPGRNKTFLLCAALLFSFFAEAQIPEGIEYNKIVYTWSHEDRVYDFPDHATATYEQIVERLSDTESIVTVKSAKTFPELRSALPVGEIPAGMEDYLAHDDFIQRDAPEIVETAELIKRKGTYDDLFTLVANVLNWNRYHLIYGNPADIPDAVKAYNEQVVNCIGYVHLPAAILRQMGIPARTVRTLMPVADRGASRHYLLEVYFPEDETWVTFEPQTLRPPIGSNTAAYIDATWNQAKHVVSRDFSRDEKTSIRRGIPYNITPTAELGQWPRLDTTAEDRPNQRIIGLTLTGNEDYFATLAYPPFSPGPAYSRHAVSDGSALHFYGHDPDGNPTMQRLYSADYFGEAIDANAGGNYANKITMGAIDPHKAVRTHLGPTIEMTDNRLAVGMHVKGYKAQEDAVWRPLRPGGQARRDSVHMGMIMMYELGDDGKWYHSQNVVQPFLGEWNGFGSAIVFHNDLMFVSAPNTIVEASQGGEIQVYRLHGDTWRFEGLVDEEESDERSSGYGRRMHSDGKRLAVSSKQGVYIYRFGGAHIERETLIEIDTEGIAPEYNPHDIHLSGNRLLIGLGDADIRGEASGAVLVYEEEDGRWLRAAVLAPDDLQRSNQFGANVLEIDGMIVASAHNQGTSFFAFGGAIYVFNQTETEVWTPTDYLRIENPIENPLVHEVDNNFNRENAGLHILPFKGELLASATGVFTGSLPGKRNGSFYRFPIPESMHRLRKTGGPEAERSTIIDVQPNPVVTVTEINFTLPEKGRVELTVSARRGNDDLTLIDETLEAGTYHIGADLLELPPGRYRAELKTPSGNDRFDLLRVDRQNLEQIE